MGPFAGGEGQLTTEKIIERAGTFKPRVKVHTVYQAHEKYQMSSSLYVRLPLSHGEANKEKELVLAQNGIAITHPYNSIHDLYVFEFLGILEDKPE